jgi:large subunit ribosomal protein L32
MSLRVNLLKVLDALAFPGLFSMPQISLRVPSYPFQQQQKGAAAQEQELEQQEQGSSLRQRLQDYLENRTQEESFFIDNGFLRAVPKKKITHQRKRRRQLGPGSKQLKYLHHLNRCPSCGHYKRAHTLCMHCVLQIRNLWKTDAGKKSEVVEQELDPVDRRVIYPGKKESEYEKELKKKEYVLKRQRTLPVERK